MTINENTESPTIILVNPQLGENIGMCARAMLNCGVTDMRIVAPRDGWPNDSAISTASGAISILENAKVFNTTKDAIADLEYVIATTARQRFMAKEVLTPNTASKVIREYGSKKCGIMFGPERTGLENDDICLANAILNIPLNPKFSSLNLAQAVLLVCFSWLNSDNHFEVKQEMDPPATKQEVDALLTHLETELEETTFFRSEEQKPNMLKNLRTFFHRIQPTSQEIRTLHGAIGSLVGKR